MPVEDCLLDHRMFRCHDGVLCIELYEVCNGKSDCLDGSDEGALCHEKGKIEFDTLLIIGINSITFKFFCSFSTFIPPWLNHLLHKFFVP